MFRIKIIGLEELNAYLEGLDERVAQVETATDGKKSISETRSELRIKGKPQRTPLMFEEHARLVVDGDVTEEEMTRAYMTVEDIADFLEGDQWTKS